MGLISRIAMGAIAGLLARRIMPGPDPRQFVVAVILGMAGVSVGGFVVGVLGGPGRRASTPGRSSLPPWAPSSCCAPAATWPGGPLEYGFPPEGRDGVPRPRGGHLRRVPPPLGGR